MEYLAFNKEGNTYYLCRLQLSTGELIFCNAGHNPPVYIGNDEFMKELSKLHGPPLGTMEGLQYKSGKLKMSPNEQIILFTDGITEALNANNQLYSESNLSDKDITLKSDSSSHSLEVLFEDVRKFRGQTKQSDDMTALSLIYKASA